MNSATPMRPSFPTTAISADAPSSMTYSSDTMVSVGKYTWRRTPPDSYRTLPSGRALQSGAPARSPGTGPGCFPALVGFPAPHGDALFEPDSGQYALQLEVVRAAGELRVLATRGKPSARTASAGA